LAGVEILLEKNERNYSGNGWNRKAGINYSSVWQNSSFFLCVPVETKFRWKEPIPAGSALLT
jgi:hypothetical protein